LNSKEEEDIFLPRALLMDKEVITRTTGRRLGYIQELYVDPSRLEVVSLYLRPSSNPIAAIAEDHVMLSSLRQVGDVVLVHDESALLDPPADETYGFYRVVGCEVETEDGTVLGRVRDYVFNPDTGAVSSIKYDALGIPSIPQSLLSCSSLSWQDVVAVGPSKVIVRRGAEFRAVKENDGWLAEYVAPLVRIITMSGDTTPNNGGGGGGEGGFGGFGSGYRSDPAYAEWYAMHAEEYERYYGQTLPKPIMTANEMQAVNRPSSRRPSTKQQQPQQARAALPPPRSVSYGQVLQPQPQPQQQQQQQQRVAEQVPVGGSSYNTNSYQQQQQRPSQMQFNGGGGGGGGGGGAVDPPSASRRRASPPPSQQQQRRPSSQPQQQQQQQQRQSIPQNGIPIVGPPSSSARRDADGNYGGGGNSRPPPPASSSSVVREQQLRRRRVVEPDAVISGGMKPPPSPPPPPPSSSSSQGQGRERERGEGLSR
jgi:sporulation protein YlmC with PRC-barrel domain